MTQGPLDRPPRCGVHDCPRRAKTLCTTKDGVNAPLCHEHRDDGARQGIVVKSTPVWFWRPYREAAGERDEHSKVES